MARPFTAPRRNSGLCRFDWRQWSDRVFEHDVQAASDSPISKAFDKLKDEKAVSQAVRKGAASVLQQDDVRTVKGRCLNCCS